MRWQMRSRVAALGFTLLAGCGMGQAVKDGTAAAAKWVFTTQVKAMNIDLTSRSSLNTNGAGRPLSTVVRIYQLKTPQAFEQFGYDQLQANDLELLKADLLATRDVVLRPDATASISEPMNEDAQYIGVVALFRDSGKDAVWKLLIPRSQWKATDPVKIIASDNVLELVGAKPESVKPKAPQQSVPKSENAAQPTAPARG
ncbi:type VI secretion system lipoprotein TssJ [Cupriavidus sp. AcVe19-6a]|uniref:type VI secretion system lipoprotein TssJ n=1 Tax=Cupriavidus sp. AcVe19-6a TaxID=2821358 RepID=UPI001AE6970E|nr:type VI secretion system lipoprotein TssJ [Cupriavidus sp. AcVe19-6a]MBP0639242.1 type VI secretion system lipoprotein TssJ [Cupriavidus sp. AcVe19-6a]